MDVVKFVQQLERLREANQDPIQPQIHLPERIVELERKGQWMDVLGQVDYPSLLKGLQCLDKLLVAILK